MASDDREREERIGEIQRMLQERAGGTMVHGGTGALPPDVRQQFWETVLAAENGPFTTDFDGCGRQESNSRSRRR